MDTNFEAPAPRAPDIFRTFGFWAVTSGAIAVVLVFLQIAGPSFEPRPSVGTQIGEIAGEIKRSAWRSFFGLDQPEPEPAAATTMLWHYLSIIAPVMGAIAIVLAVVSGVLREHWRFAVYGTGFGVAAIIFQFFWWVAVLIAGVLLLITIIENIGDIFSF